MQTMDFLAGIFVGGHSKRMLGTPKGMLQPPGRTGTLVAQLFESLRAVGLERIVLVGENTAYDHLGWPVVADSKLGRGPLAGLLGLVEHASICEIDMVLAIACDMPFVTPSFLRRLCNEPLDSADALVPKREAREPLCARYRTSGVRHTLQQQLATGNFRMMAFLDALGPRCAELTIDATQAHVLDDWDCPSDLPEGVCIAGNPLGRGTP